MCVCVCACMCLHVHICLCVCLHTYKLQKIPGILWCHIQNFLTAKMLSILGSYLEVKVWIKKYKLTFFTAFGMWSEGNATKNGKLTVGFSFMTMIPHCDHFWSMISYQRTTWQHWSIAPTLLTCLQLIFNSSVNWNRRWSDGTFVMLLTSLRMRRKSWKCFNKTASRNVSNTFTVLSEVYNWTMQLLWKQCSLNDYSVKISRKQSDSCNILKLSFLQRCKFRWDLSGIL